jgi:hypothetical protein
MLTVYSLSGNAIEARAEKNSVEEKEGEIKAKKNNS